jgi:hypothetical protein
MSDDSSVLSTFCHISQYGVQGYESLPRMIAMSRPCLWAPSSVLLKSDSSGISSGTFLKYVEAGEIRVFGRYEWLNEPGWRNSRPWSGAAWDNEIDGTVRRLCDEDSSKPLALRRVAIAPPEQGYNWADSYLASHPKEVKRWERILQSKKRRNEIPGGSREAALRDIDKPYYAARRILRDAYNHGQVISYSEADAPFLIQGMHGDFLRILSQAPPLDDQEVPGAEPMDLSVAGSSKVDVRLGELLHQLLKILAELDVHARNRGDVDALDSFIRGEGRKDLMLWMKKICSLLKRVDARDLNGVVLEQLSSDINEAHFSNVFQELLYRKDESALGLMGIVSAVIGLATDPTGIASLLGIAASAYPVGKGLIRQLGYAPVGFSGPQWPFFYAYGSRPKQRQLKQLRYVLDQLHERELGSDAG